VRRFVKGFLDLLTVKFLTGFSQRPQHLLGAVGLLCWLLGGAGLAYLGGYWVWQELHNIDPKVHERPLLIFSIGALVFGAQLMSIGFLAELIIAYQGRDTETYSISEKTDPPEPRPSNQPSAEAPLPPTAPPQPAALPQPEVVHDSPRVIR